MMMMMMIRDLRSSESDFVYKNIKKLAFCFFTHRGACGQAPKAEA